MMLFVKAWKELKRQADPKTRRLMQDIWERLVAEKIRGSS